MSNLRDGERVVRDDARDGRRHLYLRAHQQVVRVLREDSLEAALKQGGAKMGKSVIENQSILMSDLIFYQCRTKANQRKCLD